MLPDLTYRHLPSQDRATSLSVRVARVGPENVVKPLDGVGDVDENTKSKAWSLLQHQQKT